MPRYINKPPGECPLVAVVWDDIEDQDTWNDEAAELPTDCLTLTVGWLLWTGATKIVIGNSWSPRDGEWTDTLGIPRGAVDTLTRYKREVTFRGARATKGDELSQAWRNHG